MDLVLEAALISGGLAVLAAAVGAFIGYWLGRRTQKKLTKAAVEQAHAQRDQANAALAQANAQRDQANAALAQANAQRDGADTEHQRLLWETRGARSSLRRILIGIPRPAATPYELLEILFLGANGAQLCDSVGEPVTDTFMKEAKKQFLTLTQWLEEYRSGVPGLPEETIAALAPIADAVRHKTVQPGLVGLTWANLEALAP